MKPRSYRSLALIAFIAVTVKFTHRGVAADSPGVSTVPGRVIGWGDNYRGQASPPITVTNAVAIAAGNGWGLAALADGQVVSWGSGTLEQERVPPELTEVSALACGPGHVLALRRDGTVVAWGANWNGQAVVPSGLSNVVQIAAGTDHSLALRSDGSVVCWGNNSQGACTPPADLTNAVAVAGGSGFSLAARSDGTVVYWRLPASSLGGFSLALPPGLSQVTALAAWQHCLALQRDGRLVAWGMNNAGQALADGVSGVRAVALGSASSVALLSNGVVTVWGDTCCGLTDLPASAFGATAIAANGAYVLAIVPPGNTNAPPLMRPSVISEPQSLTVTNGDPASFVVVAAGQGTLTYLWRKDGVALAGETNSVLTISSAGSEHQGDYQVIVRNSIGSVTSVVARLTVVRTSPVMIPSRFFNFETAPVHPVALGPDERTLAVCNLPDARVELFDVSSGVPVPIGNVPVGLDPVTVRFHSTNELWVVNHISSSISVINLASRHVVATFSTPAGPSDLVFAGQPRRAWISCSRTNSVLVVDPLTRAAVASIPIEGERPRAMATSPDGSKVYVAIFESGNGTTVIGRKLTPLDVLPPPGPVDDVRGPYGGRNPPPNAGPVFFPAINTTYSNQPPQVSHIVRRTVAGRWMDDNHGDWTEWVSGTNAAMSSRMQGWDLPDRDVAIIDTATLAVSYVTRLMNICMALGVNPASGQLAVVGTEALNEVRFEPVLKGVFLRVNLALVNPVSGSNRIVDLNPHLDYVTRTLPEAERAFSLSDPRGIEWNTTGTRAYITGMGSRNLIVVDAQGVRVQSRPVELAEGPTGLALDEPRGRLYVWNRFSSSLSVVATDSLQVLTNIAVFDPTPEMVRKGRRHLYDSRQTSGLGITSCASCHVDARFDRLAWDLGNPAGDLVTNQSVAFHPMKGPMVTQTLQDIITPPSYNGQPLTQAPLHWRGDRKNIEEFNPTFTKLQANEVELTPNEMAEFKAMLASIHYPPNLLRNFDNSLAGRVSVEGLFFAPSLGSDQRVPMSFGEPRRVFTDFTSDCRGCHDFNSGRTTVTNEIAHSPRNGTQGAFKFPQLRNVVERTGMDGLSTNSRAGFGFMHDGRIDTLTRLIGDAFPGATVGIGRGLPDTIALIFSMSGSDVSSPQPLPPVGSPSQDVPAASGAQTTLSSNTPSALLNAMMELARRTNGRVELIVRGRAEGRQRQWLMRRATGDFLADRENEILPNLQSVIAPAAPGNEFTAILVPEGSGVRLGLDRDGDGAFDGTELEHGSNPADPRSRPERILSVAREGPEVRLRWESTPGIRYTVEWAAGLSLTNGTLAPWSVLAPPLKAFTNVSAYTDAPPTLELRRFYRIRRD